MTAQKIILVVEDDPISIKLISKTLEKHGFTPLQAVNGQEAEYYLSRQKPDAIILDLKLPDANGLEILEKIRTNTVYSKVPVLILTANDNKLDTVLALETGADDYITKPFHQRELIARLNSQLRRVQMTDSMLEPIIRLNNLELNTETRQASINNETVELTYSEFELLHFLLSNQGRVLSRDTLLNQLWGYDSAEQTRTVDIHISSIRKKLGEYGKYIKTVRGVGYRFLDVK